MRHNSCIAALALFTFCGQAVAQTAIVAEPAPTQPAVAQPGAYTPAKAKRPPLYDTAADGKAQIAAAIAKASRNNTRVLIQWGAEWCGWCHLLQGTFTTDRQIATLLRNEYEVVHIDIGQWDKHMDLAAKYGADLKAHGVPFLTVLDAFGKAIANQETGSLERKPAKEGEQVENSHDPAKVRAFLEAHKAPPVAAADVLAAAKSRAASEGKLIFLHFGAPWCGWCHKLEDWMARPDIALVLAKDFIDVKIDTDRMTGGKEMHVKTAGGDGGIPWFAFLSPDGKVVSHSGRPGAEPGDTVGFPFEPFEIEHFKTMLKAVYKNITDADIDLLVKSLTENAAKEKAKQTR